MGFERFTERARHVVVLAGEEARNGFSAHVTTGHLLGGLVLEDEGLAARVLEGCGVTIAAVRDGYMKTSDHRMEGQIPFTPRFRKAMDDALRAALSRGHNYIGTEHLLLGLVQSNRTDERPEAFAMLEKLGVTREEIKDGVDKMLSGPSKQPKPPRWVVVLPAKGDVEGRTFVSTALPVEEAAVEAAQADEAFNQAVLVYPVSAPPKRVKINRDPTAEVIR